MKPFFFITIFVVSSTVFEASAQYGQAKNRAKDLVNQNNARQGVTPPSQSQPAKTAPVVVARPVVAATNTVSTVNIQAQNVARIERAISAIKSGEGVTDTQKQQLKSAISVAARSTKPSQTNLTALVDSLAPAIADTKLAADQQSRLARNLEAAVNAKPFASSQFDAIITDVESLLQNGDAKTKGVEAAAKSLKSIGDETRK